MILPALAMRKNVETVRTGTAIWCASLNSTIRGLVSVIGFVVARYIIVVVALATAISLLAQQISSIKKH